MKSYFKKSELTYSFLQIQNSSYGNPDLNPHRVAMVPATLKTRLHQPHYFSNAEHWASLPAAQYRTMCNLDNIFFQLFQLPSSTKKQSEGARYNAFEKGSPPMENGMTRSTCLITRSPFRLLISPGPLSHPNSHVSTAQYSNSSEIYIFM